MSTRGAVLAGTAPRARVARGAALQRMAPLALVAPSLFLAVAVLGYPLWQIIHLSVSNVSRFGLVRGFVGLANFSTVFADPVFRATVLRTLVWTASVVAGTVLLSLPVALVLRRDFIGRGVARTIIMLPWAISLSMAAIIWLWSFDGDHGMINTTLVSLGLLAKPIQWMARAGTAFPIEIGVGILVSVPFTVTILLGGLASIPGDVYEAAAIDGATGVQAFRWMTLPLLRSFITIAVVLNVIYVFNSFPIIWVMTQGGPDEGTQILVTYLYETAFRLGRPGQAAVMSLVTLAIVLVFSMIYVRMQREDKT